MVEIEDVRVAADAIFADTGRHTPGWPDPRPDGALPVDDAYSVVTNPARYRILAVRADAWIAALVDRRFAAVEPGATITWATDPLPVTTRAERVIPVDAGALEL